MLQIYIERERVKDTCTVHVCHDPVQHPAEVHASVRGRGQTLAQSLGRIWIRIISSSAASCPHPPFVVVRRPQVGICPGGGATRQRYRVSVTVCPPPPADGNKR